MDDLYKKKLKTSGIFGIVLAVLMALVAVSWVVFAFIFSYLFTSLGFVSITGLFGYIEYHYFTFEVLKDVPSWFYMVMVIVNVVVWLVSIFHSGFAVLGFVFYLVSAILALVAIKKLKKGLLIGSLITGILGFINALLNCYFLFVQGGLMMLLAALILLILSIIALIKAISAFNKGMLELKNPVVFEAE